jgi:RNA polymerase sigma-70 factor, ECF subfamily
MTEGETIYEKMETNSDYEWINELIDNYGRSLQQLVFTYVNDYAMAEDLTQEIFLKCYKKLHTFKQKSSIKTWLYSIAINHCKDHLRSWHHRSFVFDDQLINELEANDHDMDQAIIKKSEQEILVLAVLRLDLKYREVVYLYYYEELTTKEISQLTKENENTIKTRLNRAKKMIKNQLTRGDYHYE